MSAVNVATGAVEPSQAQAFSDLLVFGGPNPGDDAQIVERKRILALLDLPRPEMVINAWVMQNSSPDPESLGRFDNIVRGLVGSYDDAIDSLIRKGQQSVKRQILQPGFFNEPYYRYLTGRFVADAPPVPANLKPQEAAQRFLDFSPVTIADRNAAAKIGLCPANQYCLGYGSIFNTSRPSLTDFLLTLIAAERPVAAADIAVAAVESPKPQEIVSDARCEEVYKADRWRQERCIAIRANLALNQDYSYASVPSCTKEDYRNILGSLPADADHTKAPLIFLECFKEKADTLLGTVGPLRAAVADFLFNYKLSQQYPHEFRAYDLSQSASALNTALAPFIDGFNRDIVAFQTFMRADVQYQIDRLNSTSGHRCCIKRLIGADKPSFFNDGIITIHTISGQPTSASVTTQSFLDATTAPSISNLVNAIAGSAVASNPSPLTAAGGPSLASASLLAAALNAYQTTVAQIGRSLTLTVTPRTLATASAAEINVTIQADDVPGTPFYSGGPQGNNPNTVNTSHVASHDTTTRVRVDALKLFEVSSFSAILQRARSKFPLLPPFVEIPYLGTILGVPIPGAKEYHNSSAIMSAMVVPTAADIADGLRFGFDQVAEGPSGNCNVLPNGQSGVNVCLFRTALSMRDLNQLPVRSFHRSMINCFSTELTSPNPGVAGLLDPDRTSCAALTFDNVIREGN